MHYEAPIREPLIQGDKSYHDITVDVARPVETAAPRSWWIVFTLALVAFLWGVGCILYTIGVGIGTWGLNKTVGWAWDITNFVWWVGIGHAGTLISAILLLFSSKVADVHQPLCGSDDHFFSNPGSSFSRNSHGSYLAGLFRVPNP